MKRVSSIFLLLICTTAGAEVFRQVGPDGEVSFTDRPAPGAERMEMAPLQTIDVPPTPPRSSAIQRSNGERPDAKKSASRYGRFSILSPSNGQSVRANDGNVTVSLSLEPTLVQGHSIELIVDGEGGAKTFSGTALSFRLSELPRGEHSLTARIKNGRGEQLMETGPVTFFVLRVALGGG